MQNASRDHLHETGPGLSATRKPTHQPESAAVDNNRSPLVQTSLVFLCAKRKSLNGISSPIGGAGHGFAL